jgi:hypothetical protein
VEVPVAVAHQVLGQAVPLPLVAKRSQHQARPLSSDAQLHAQRGQERQPAGRAALARWHGPAPTLPRK